MLLFFASRLDFILDLKHEYQSLTCFCVRLLLCCYCSECKIICDIVFQNWIGNERRRLRTNNSTSGGVRKKPPQKVRAPNSYNLFVKDFFKTAGM